MVYCMHVALFWKSMVVLEESVVEFVQHPLIWVRYVIEQKHCCWIVLKIFFLSEICLNEGWADLTKGKSTHVKQKKSSFPGMLLLHRIFLPYRTIFCCSLERSERALFNSAHSFKHVALLKGMLYVNNTAFFCRNIDFSKRGTAPLKWGLDIWKCTLRSFKGHGATLKEYFIFCLDIATHGIAPKEDYSNVCFLILHLLAGMGML